MVTPLTINYNKYVKGVPYVNRDRRYTRRVSFLAKMVYKRVRGWTSGWGLPVWSVPRIKGMKKKFHLLFCKILEKCKWNWVDIGEARIFFLEIGGF